jgi:hypothetical protein
MLRFFSICAVFACASAGFAAANLSITAEPYLTGGLFTDPLLPQEGQPVTITVRAQAPGEIPDRIPVALAVRDRSGKAVLEQTLDLERAGNIAETHYQWTAATNGLYTIAVKLDPKNTIRDENEQDNAAEIVLPVLTRAPNHALHFPWYGEMRITRWATCITSIDGQEGTTHRLAERGVMPLRWEYGGASWNYYDKEKARSNPDQVAAEIEDLFYKKFCSGGEDVHGFGIDEVGGYPGTFSLQASVASLQALVRARKEGSRRFFAVWNGGGLRPEIASVARQGVDLLLLETYLWRALPDELGCEDIYAAIESRIEPLVRSSDMFQPAYGNSCCTLIGLDTSERPDRTDLGEQEQVVRFIRGRFPEMRGIAWYNGGYGNKAYGMTPGEKADRHHEAVLANADRLCFEYWIKPCVTLMRESLWLTRNAGASVLTVAVSNIGGMDAHNVSVEFFVDGASAGVQTADNVPAGANRSQDRVMLKLPVSAAAGPHTFEARITAAPESTVLNSAVKWDRFIP